MKQRLIYAVMALGGSVGWLAAFLQMLEKIQLLKGASKPLICDVNSVFSCTNVLSAWQSSVFGFPNSLMCMTFFMIFATIGLVGLSGGALPRKLRLGIHALAVFVLLFGLWFLWQSIYDIAAICILCVFCFSGLLLVNWAWLRINVDDLPVSARIRDRLERAIKTGADTFGWILLALIIAFAMLTKFY